MKEGVLCLIERYDYYIPNRMHKAALFKCVCGKEFIGSFYDFKKGVLKGCGCLRGKNKGNLSHGMSKTRLYRIWAAMLHRCYNENNPAFKHYGGRSISVCIEWKKFENFKRWALLNGYKEELTLDRYPNMNGNYEPNNCRWATWFEQGNNRRDNVFITHNGKTQTASEWSRETGVSLNIINKYLLKYKVSAEDVFSKNLPKIGWIWGWVRDEKVSNKIKQWLKDNKKSQLWLSKESGISPCMIHGKLNVKYGFKQEEFEKIKKICGINFDN